MKVSKDAARAAKRIYNLCAPNGQLNEANIKASVAMIIERKPRDYRAILHAITRLVRLDSESRQALIESASELDSESRNRVEGNLTAQYGSGLSFSYKITPELLGGVRMRVGDDVLDGSVKARIERLKNAF